MLMTRIYRSHNYKQNIFKNAKKLSAEDDKTSTCINTVAQLLKTRVWYAAQQRGIDYKGSRVCILQPAATASAH